MINMEHYVSSVNLPKEIAAQLFVLLNEGDVWIEYEGCEMVLVTDINPKELTYPEGWYFAKECFRNKHNTTLGAYYQVFMQNSKGVLWE